MKKIILALAIFAAPAIAAFGQEATPADTGAASTQEKRTPADTGAVPPLPADTGTAFPQDTLLDTLASPPPKRSAPPDTGTVAPPPSDTGRVAPVDTGTVAPPPADTSVVPQEQIPPADTAAAPVPQESAPTETAATPQEEAVLRPEPKPNRVGLGIIFNDEAPLSMRAWFNPKVGLDVGIGLRGRRVDDSSTISDTVPTPRTRTTLLDFTVDLGIPVRAIRKEKVDFIIRPGFGFRTRPFFELEPERSVETALELEVNGSVGIEYFPFEKASFSLQAGIALVAERTGGVINNTNLRLESFPRKGTNFAFRYYLF